VSAPIVSPPDWLLERFHPPAPLAPPTRQRGIFHDSDSIADWFTATRTWADVLTNANWTCKSNDGDADGARWRHTTATSPVSATVKHGCLFVYSDNTPFEATTAEHPHGYTKFRAWAVLEHGGDLSAAARAARELRKVPA
jgi:hypothetical protein